MSVSPRWLLYLLELARAKRWCTKHGCTTCGAGGFRSTLCILLCRNASIQPPDGYGDGRIVALPQLFPTSLHAVVEAAVDDMIHADEAEVIAVAGDRWASDLLMILSELRLAPHLYPDLPLTLKLKGSRIWAAVIANAEADLEWARVRRENYARRLEADLARKAESVMRRAVAAKERQERYAHRSTVIADAIARFRTLPAQERLAALADDRFGLPLEAVPAEDLPDDHEASATLPSEARAALIERIGRRKGMWVKLKADLVKVGT